MKARPILLLFLFLIFSCSGAFAATWFVKEEGTGNGASWQTASGNIQDLINTAASGDEIWVAAGTYQPASGKGFSMKEGVKIYGGFAGDEVTLASRDLKNTSNKSTLQGNGNAVVYNFENGLTHAAVLNGFTITGGRGGIVNYSSSPTLVNLIITQNNTINGGSGNAKGGGIFNSQSSPAVTSCIISNNRADTGGGIYNTNSSPVLTNCLIRDNTVTYAVTGIYNTASAPVLTNCTIISNDQSVNGSIYNEDHSVFKLRNSIVYGEFSYIFDNNSNSDITYSLVQGIGNSNPGNHNISGDVDPLFVNAAEGNYQLQPCSPVLRKGPTTFYTKNSQPDLSDITTDLAGNGRFFNGSAVDLGAYQFTAPVAGVVFVKEGATGLGTTWECASGNLQAAIDAATSGLQIWVARGTYQPAGGEGFRMKEGVEIYGGFAGTEKNLAERDLTTTDKSILKGNDNVVVDNDVSLTNAAVLDGFTVTGGLYGGISNNSASPMLVNLIITSNENKNGYGGGISNIFSSPILINCLISKNIALSGGAMFNGYDSSPILTNCTIGNNTGLSDKEAIYNENSTPVFRNSIVYGNTGGIKNDASSVPVIQYSLVQGETNLNPDDHNIRSEIDPFFADTTSGNYQLQFCSAVVNKGNNAYYAAGTEPNLSELTMDLGGNARLYNNGLADMGAYEYQGNVPTADAKVVYVKAGGTGSGISWECAIGSLQPAIDGAISGQQIWVAGGTYSPTGLDYFTMKEGVKVYGGFAGGETDLASRNLNTTNNKSILQGNSEMYVISYENVTNTTVLDGFTITGGKSGGILNISGSSPTLVNLIITGNHGGDLSTGGGITNYESSPNLINCVIYGNSTENGGGIYNYMSFPVIVNSTIANNITSGQGGGMFNSYGSVPKLYNSIVYGNSSGIAADEDTPAALVRYSLVQGMNSTDDDNIPGNFNPLFVNAAAGNYQLLGCSPVLNKGSNAYYAGNSEPDLSKVSTDLMGNTRFFNNGVADMGAYEYLGQAAESVPDIVFVKEGNGGSGTSWGCATGDLQSAIDMATSGQQVWVAGGTYQPATGSSFRMKEGVKIYGGFAGNEQTLAQRNLSDFTNKSILQGNNYPVVNNADNGLTKAAVLDGFTITGGIAGSIVNSASSPMLVNLTITGNNGGSANGGGMTNSKSSPTLVNCIIYNNTATDGGAMLNLSSSSPVIINSTIVGNSAAGSGFGGIKNSDNSSPKIYNTIVYGNTGGIKNDASSVTVIRYSLVQGETNPNPDDHNISGIVNPLFVNAAAGNYQLLPCSQAINTGSNDYYADGAEPDLSQVTTDLTGNTRLFNNGVADMGAYEYQGSVAAPIAGIVFVKEGGTGSGTNWDCAAGDLQSAIDIAASGQQIWVAGGSYQPVSGSAFNMKEGVKIYGGFAGTETTLASRNLTNKSVLRGNGVSVVSFNNLSKATALDGFTITAGAASGVVNRGSSPVLANLTITGNNNLVANGGGISNTKSSPTLINCIIYGNSANNGGAISNLASSPVITNCTIAGNNALVAGLGGIYNSENSSPKFYNSVVYGNAGGIQSDATSVPVIRYSLVQGEASLNPDDHNIPDNVDPLFVDAAGGNYQFQLCSPLMNKGNNAYYAKDSDPDLSDIITDVTGSSRFFNNGLVDLGAYEYQGYIPGVVANVVYVKEGGTGLGTSWECPIGDLQLAINSAESGQQVWVARGTYQGPGEDYIIMKEGVKVYGGFAGTETDFASRDLNNSSNNSMLQGNSELAVVYFQELSKATVLDGFTISGGKFGGVLNTTGSSPMLVNLIITGNTSADAIAGGGITNFDSSPNLINCLIYGNLTVNGGGIYNYNSFPVLVNSTISNNQASGQGGGMFNSYGSVPKLYNSIIYGNSSGLAADDATPAAVIEYSLVQGENGTDHHNIPGDTDPLFGDAATGNYQLLPCSPVINRGSNAYYAAGLEPDISAVITDLSGFTRFYDNNVVDMGVYEFAGSSGGLAFDGDMAAGTVSGDLNLVANGSACRNVAYLLPNGSSPISGEIIAKVWVEDAQPQNFVKRHYQITPVANASGATARVTLYFTQQEFTDFNTVSSLKLPVDAEDKENYKANLRIEKRAGVSSDDDGLPNSYSGSIETITPSAANGKVEWNAGSGRWEVTFEVKGFSGFFVKTTESALPLRLISFTARKDDGGNLLQWSTASEVNTGHFEIQSSEDAKTFIKIVQLNAAGSGENQYSYYDETIYSGTVYYRLKMSDLDGTFTYSKIVSLMTDGAATAIYPNPATDAVTFRVSSALLKSTVVLYDLAGRRLQSILITNNQQQINLKSLPGGLYILKFADGTAERFVKE
jgi:hypothetical protein